jgi:hypothetical protein
MNRTAEEQLLLNYLLGDLPDEEKARVEERMFADDAFSEQIEAMKAELADEYARGEMTARERSRYEGRFLISANGRQRVAFARTMARAFAQAPVAAPEKSSWRRFRPDLLSFFSLRAPALPFAMAAALLLLTLSGGWLLWQNRNLRAQLDRAQAEQSRMQREAELASQQQRTRGEELATALDRERAEREKLQQELDRARGQQSPPASPAFVSFLLSPGLVRDRGEPEKLSIPSTARQIRLRLDTGGDDSYRSFRAELRTMRGALILNRDGLSGRATASGLIVPLTISASALSPGEYELTLKGIARRGDERDLGYYYFSIVKN